ncbi:curculin-2 [Arthrobacter sp. Hiyo6]|jgi:streptogrisin C|nr:curculin-2 [Arthrobacter sp. Hiyo6]
MANTLKAGDSLDAGTSLVSANERFTLAMQGDGNLVLYQDGVAAGHNYWSTETEWFAPAQRPTVLTLHADAQLELDDAAGAARWNSGTWGPFTDPKAVLQDDGNLVVSDISDQPIWASGQPG